MSDIKQVALQQGRSEAEADALARDVNSARVVIYVVAFITLLALLYYFGVVWLNTLWFHNYPKAGTPPVPGSFVSTRFSFLWITVALLVVNLFLPFLLVLVGLFPLRKVFFDLHLVVLFLSFLVNAFVFVVMLWFFCTANSSTYQFNEASDYRYCGVYYMSATDRCPNVTPFNPPVVASDLSANGEFKHHLWGPLILIGWGVLVQLLLNLRLRYYLRGIRQRLF